MNASEWVRRTALKRRTEIAFAFAVVGAAGLMAQAVWAQKSYQKPPKAILDVLNAPLTPQASISPSRDAVLLYTPELYPPIADVAQPFLRIAGVRIDAATNGPHNPPRFDHLVLKRVADGSEKKGIELDAAERR